MGGGQPPSARSEPGEGGPFRKEPLSAESSVFLKRLYLCRRLCLEASGPSYQKRRYKRNVRRCCDGKLPSKARRPPVTAGGAFRHEPEKEAGGGPLSSRTPDPRASSIGKAKRKKARAAKLRMEKRGKRWRQPRTKLAAQKPPGSPGPVKRAGRAAGRTVHGYVHGKSIRCKDENVWHRGRPPYRARGRGRLA